MGTGYTRQSAAEIQNGQQVIAAPLSAEFDALVAAFHATSGHSHDATAGEGPKIALTTSVSGVLPIANGGIAAKHNPTATVPPTVNDDSGAGYGTGSLWTNTAGGVMYYCTSASVGAAVWVSLAQSSINMIGAVVAFATATAPASWLKANGAAVLISTYSELATAIYCGDANNATAAWGYKTTSAVSPSTNRSTAGTYIVLPDLRGEFIRGFDDAKGTDSGRVLWATQTAAVEAHTHTGTTASDGSHTHGGTTASGGGHTPTGAANSGGAHTHTFTTDSGGAHTPTGTIASDGAHTHTASSDSTGAHTHTGTTGTESVDHSHSGTTSTDGAHTHTTSAYTNTVGGGFNNGSNQVATLSTITSSSSGSHNHTFSTGGRSAAHTHSFTSDSGGTHSHTITVNSGGAHTHTLTMNAVLAHTHTGTTVSAGAHTHTLTMDAVAAHTHTFTTDSGGAHTHTFTTASYGGTETRPRNIALLYCIRYA